MKACESLTTNGSCMIILKTEEMFHWSSINTKKYIIMQMKAELSAINSAWPCRHMLVVYWNPSIMFPPAYESTGCTGASAVQPISLVTMQHQSIVLWQSHFQGHIITALDTAWAILVGTEQTGIGPAAINLYGKREREKCPFMSCCITLHARLQEPGFWSPMFSDVAISIWLPAHCHKEQVGQSAE